MSGAEVLETVRAAIRRHAMLASGDRILVAVSGGADSTALLHVLALLAPEWRLDLRVLHVDHGLRPDSARDADAVRALGTRLGVPVDVARVTVPAGGSLEAAARAARYRALETWADRVGATRIALGHTADDQAETVLMRVLEGTGLRGLAGIPPVRGRFIRPLIGVRRAAIVAWLQKAGLSWVEDPSNRDLRFTRNRVRHEVLPRLAESTGVDLVASLARVARHAREATHALERLAAGELDRLADPAGDAIVLPRSSLAALPPSIAGEVLRLAAARLGSCGPLRAWQHRGLRRILAAPPPRRPFRLGGLVVEVSGDRLRIGRERPSPLAARPLPVPGRVVLDEIGVAIEARRCPAAGYLLPRDDAHAAFDADALPGPLVVRPRRPGDRFRPFGGPGERRLKAFLVDARIPRWDRDRVALVEAGGAIAWVAGLRRGAVAPVTPATRDVVELALEPLASASPAG